MGGSAADSREIQGCDARGLAQPASQKESKERLTQNLQFITFQNPSGMRNRAHRKLVHVHSIKEHARKSRFTSIQKLQNFKNATVNRGREDRQNPEYNRRKRQGVSETPEIGSKTQLGLGRLDPFESLPINSRRVSFLLSSEAARPAMEPLFSLDDIGSHSLPAVFGLGLGDPAFFHAFMLSITFVLNGGALTTECLIYKAEAMRSLNEKMQSPQTAMEETSIGAIMLLTGIEYRTGSRETHEMHMRGLAQMIGLRNSAGRPLNVGVIRALFWQDLVGAVVSGSTRLFDHDTFPELRWNRQSCDSPSSSLPSGFQTYLHLVGHDLCVTIQDIETLKAVLERSRIEGTKSSVILEIDNMQASIESRLYSFRNGTDETVECCRLAAYICAYLFFSDIWNAHLVPQQLSKQLAQQLALTNAQWDDKVDLVIWLCFIGGACAKWSWRDVYVKLLSTKRGLCGTWERTEEILRTFIWDPVAFREPCKALWEEIALGWSDGFGRANERASPTI